MLTLCITFYFPIAMVLYFVLKLYIIICWEQTIKFKNFFYINTPDIFEGKEYKNFTKLFLEIFIVFSIVFFSYFFFFLKISNFNINFFYFHNLIFVQLFMFSIFFFLIIFVFYNKSKTIYKYDIDFIWILISFFILPYIILLSNNIINVFIVLEILNIIILFSFLQTSITKSLSNDNHSYDFSWFLNLIIYQFVLNFFSSILFFFAYCSITNYTLSSSLFIIGQIDTIFYNFSNWIILFYTAFFFKFGIGPWIFFKIEIYKNFNLILLIIYTTLYFTVILTFFFNLFIIYYLPFFYIFNLIIFFFLICVSLFFFLIINIYFNIFIFFSFSSLANFVNIIFQFLVIIFCLI